MSKPDPARTSLARVGRSRKPAKAWNIVGPVSIFLVVALLSTLIFGASRGKERQQRREEFILQAQQLAYSIETAFEVPREILGSVAALFHSSSDVSRTEFKTFVQPIIERHPSIYAFEWMPLITHAVRDSFVQAVRAEGFPDFRVLEKSPDLALVPAGERPEYLPILYMEPLEAVILGLDVIGNPERGDESLRARETGTSTASDRYSLLEDPPDVFSVISYEPVWNTLPGSTEREFVGLVGVLLRIDSVVRNAVAGGASRTIRILLRDESAPPEKQVLFDSTPGLGPEDPEGAWKQEFLFADRRYSTTLAPLPGSTFTPGHGPVALWGAGILLGVLAAFGSGALLQIGRLRRRVDEAVELGQYRLGRLLGEGGMGVVYEAEHRMLARSAAIKLIRPDAAGDRTPEQHRVRIRRFEREAKATAALRSPHTIQVYDFGHTEEGLFYYVMELLDGFDLNSLVEHGGPIESARAVHILRQTCESLAEAHAGGLVHRDIKPANIYLCHHGLEYDFVKVLDFGLVRSEGKTPGQDQKLTNKGVFAGTPMYCAPEMITAKGVVDGRSDLYSLGCVAYWLLTGRPPFEGNSPYAIVSAHLHVEPTPPSILSEIEIAPELESIVLWCLHKDPEKRPRDAEELARRLEKCASTSRWTQKQARAWWDLNHPATHR